MSTASVLPSLDISALKGFAPQKIVDGAGLQRVADFLQHTETEPLKPWDNAPALGLDTETNITVEFFYRRIRSIQIGNDKEQYLIDLLAFTDGNENKLYDTQGYYGKNSGIFNPVKDVLRPALCSNKFLKVGANLPFEYEVLNWNLGLGIWNLFSIDLAEKVIWAGAHTLKDYGFFSLQSIVARYFKKLVDKSLQQSFDLKSPLTEQQVLYGCLDTYLPLAVRQQQLKVLSKDQLFATAQIENDAIGAYTDMHINGQNVNKERWMTRVNTRKEEYVVVVSELDKYTIPIVGLKSEAIDETKLNNLEKAWRGFDIASQAELEACSAYKAVSAKKEPQRREELKKIYLDMLQGRKSMKAAARVTYMELSKKRTKAKQLIEKCAGAALINYNSPQQIVNIFNQIQSYKQIDSTDKKYLQKFIDKPLVKTYLTFSKLKKEIGTYGETWVKAWLTKPCKEEGWLHPGDGRLHCLYNQLQAETGRSSSSKPNAQNLPKEDEIRACFCCDPPNENIRISVCCDDETTYINDGVYACNKCSRICETKAEEYVIVTVDMSGAELRIIAELANAETWIRAFALGQDVHSVGTEILYPEKWPTLTVHSVLKPGGWTLADCKTELIPLFNTDGSPLMKKGKHISVPPCAYFALKEDGSYARQKCECPEHKKLRDNNKATNFLLAYGGGPGALAEALGITPEAAKELMALHAGKFPDIWGYLERSGRQAVHLLEARDMFGRRRRFPKPTWDSAAEFFIQEHDDELELEEDVATNNILLFKQRELREPTDDEEWMLTHSKPSSKQISSMLRGLHGSIERRGKNHCIQATNASIIKRAMGCGFDKDGRGYLWHLLPQYKAKLLSMVHDELILQCPKRYGQQVLALVGDAFKRAAAEVMSKVVMEFDGHVSDRWEK